MRLNLRNSNQYAIPHDIGVPGFFLAGDTTWPGLGTVACVLGSRLVAEQVLAHHRRQSGRSDRANQRPEIVRPIREDCHEPAAPR